MKEDGYQLLECLVVCLVISSLAGLGVSAFGRSVDRYRLEAAAQGLAAGLMSLRSAAVSRKVALSVLISDTRSAYGFGVRNSAPGFWKELPRGVTFVSRPGQALSFYSRGNAVPAGSYELSNSAGQCKVIVSPTGRIRWEYLK